MGLMGLMVGLLGPMGLLLGRLVIISILLMCCCLRMGLPRLCITNIARLVFWRESKWEQVFILFYFILFYFIYFYYFDC